MKRIQLFEFEDFHWFPKTIRTSMTNLIIVLEKMMGTSAVISQLILDIKDKYNFSQIVDLGSGSGGPMPEAVKKLNQNLGEHPVQLLLSDLHPNPDFIKKFNQDQNEHIRYLDSSLDATHLNNAPKGLKTMMNSFHHMPPEQARQILVSAQENKEPLLIYELAENNIPTLLWWILLPLSLSILIIMSWCMTPFVKPLTWQQLLFTYLIPIIPLCYAWDGQASIMRIYTFDDIENVLLKDMPQEDYQWTIERAHNKKGKKAGYYVLGIPKNV